MKTKNLSILKIILAIMCFVCLGAGGIIGYTNSAYAISEPVFSMTGTASIYMDPVNTEVSAIKFTANVTDETKDYQMLIVPSDYLEKAGVTFNGNEDYIAMLEQAKKDGKLSYKNLLISDKLVVKNNTVSFGMKNILVNNYDRNFFGIAFYTENGNKVYADLDSSANRSVSFVASKTLNNTDVENPMLPEQIDTLNNYVVKSFANVGAGEFNLDINNVTDGQVITENQKALSANIPELLKGKIDVKYSTSDSETATVDENGMVTSVKDGEFKVNAKIGDIYNSEKEIGFAVGKTEGKLAPFSSTGNTVMEYAETYANGKSVQFEGNPELVNQKGIYVSFAEGGKIVSNENIDLSNSNPYDKNDDNYYGTNKLPALAFAWAPINTDATKPETVIDAQTFNILFTDKTGNEYKISMITEQATPAYGNLKYWAKCDVSYNGTALTGGDIGYQSTGNRNDFNRVWINMHGYMGATGISPEYMTVRLFVDGATRKVVVAPPVCWGYLGENEIAGLDLTTIPDGFDLTSVKTEMWFENFNSATSSIHLMHFNGKKVDQKFDNYLNITSDQIPEIYLGNDKTNNIAKVVSTGDPYDGTIMTNTTYNVKTSLVISGEKYFAGKDILSLSTMKTSGSKLNVPYGGHGWNGEKYGYTNGLKVELASGENIAFEEIIDLANYTAYEGCVVGDKNTLVSFVIDPYNTPVDTANDKTADFQYMFVTLTDVENENSSVTIGITFNHVWQAYFGITEMNGQEKTNIKYKGGDLANNGLYIFDALFNNRPWYGNDTIKLGAMSFAFGYNSAKHKLYIANTMGSFNVYVNQRSFDLPEFNANKVKLSISVLTEDAQPSIHNGGITFGDQGARFIVDNFNGKAI